MIHLFLAVPLLASPPGLVERLQLGVEPAPRVYSATPGEVAAGVGGVLVGHGLALAALMNQDQGPLRNIFESCDFDVCSPSPLMYFAVFGGELVLAPLAAAGFADLVSPDPNARFLRSWGISTLVHLGGLALMLPGAFIGGSSGLGLALIVAAMVIDVGLTGYTAADMLHDAPPPEALGPAPVVLPPEPPKPMDQPPPHAGNALVVPLVFAF